jgi:transcriptional regulator with XRE-family HTH domain
MDDTYNSAAFLKSFSRHLKQVRKSKGYSQDRLALEAGLSRGAISKIEKGSDIKLSTLGCIAHTLDVPLEKMFKGF